MFRSSIAFTELTVNSACDELFPGVEDVDAQSTLQLRAALDAFEEGVFEYHNRVGQAAAEGPPPDAGGSKGPGKRRTRREQAYASRIPEDRQFFRPVEVQSAEWAAFKPHLWLRGRQVQSAEPSSHSHHAVSQGPVASTAAAHHPSSSSPAIGGKPAGAPAGAPAAAVVDPSASEPSNASDLVVYGNKIRLVPPSPGYEANEEVIAAHGNDEETFVVQHDEWETHVPAHLRRRRGRPRDEKAVAVGLPPVAPRNAALYEVAEMLLPEVWTRLAPLLTPVLNRLAVGRREQTASRAASSAFRGGGTAAGLAGGRGALGGNSGVFGAAGEFEIITFSSDGEEEAQSGDGLLGASDGFGMGYGLGGLGSVGGGGWPGAGGADSGGLEGYGYGGDDDDDDDEEGEEQEEDGGFRVPQHGRRRGPPSPSLCGGAGDAGAAGVGGAGGGMFADYDSYDSEDEGPVFGLGVLGQALSSGPSSPRRSPDVAARRAPQPAAAAATAAAAAGTASTSAAGPAAAAGRTSSPPGPPPVLPRDYLPPADAALAPAVSALAPLQRSPLAVPPVIQASGATPSPRSSFASPAQLHAAIQLQLQPSAVPFTQVHAPCSGDEVVAPSPSSGTAAPATLQPPPLPPSQPLALVGQAPHALSSPRGSGSASYHALPLQLAAHGSAGASSGGGAPSLVPPAGHHQLPPGHLVLGVGGGGGGGGHSQAGGPCLSPRVQSHNGMPGTPGQHPPHQQHHQQHHQQQQWYQQQQYLHPQQQQQYQQQVTGGPGPLRMPSLSRIAGVPAWAAGSAVGGSGWSGGNGGGGGGGGAAPPGTGSGGGVSSSAASMAYVTQPVCSHIGSGALAVSGGVVPGSATAGNAGGGRGGGAGGRQGGRGGGGAAGLPHGAHGPFFAQSQPPATRSPVAALSQYSRFLAGPAGAAASGGGGGGGGVGTGGGGGDKGGVLSASTSFTSLPSATTVGAPAGLTGGGGGSGNVAAAWRMAGAGHSPAHHLPLMARPGSPGQVGAASGTAGGGGGGGGAVGTAGPGGLPATVALRQQPRPRRQQQHQQQQQQAARKQVVSRHSWHQAAGGGGGGGVPLILQRSNSGCGSAGASGNASPVVHTSATAAAAAAGTATLTATALAVVTTATASAAAPARRSLELGSLPVRPPVLAAEPLEAQHSQGAGVSLPTTAGAAAAAPAPVAALGSAGSGGIGGGVTVGLGRRPSKRSIPTSPLRRGVTQSQQQQGQGQGQGQFQQPQGSAAMAAAAAAVAGGAAGVGGTRLPALSTSRSTTVTGC